MEVNDSLQRMADDISADFMRNPSAHKIRVAIEPPNQSFYYTFDGGRKIKLSFMPGGSRGIIIYEMRDHRVMTFDINSFTVNNWINEFSKLRTFAR